MKVDRCVIADKALEVAAWRMYLAAFGELNALAAQRHLMTSDEFHHVMADPRVEKFTISAGARVCGLAVMTDRLDAWPLISPAYFARRYPGRHVFYIGFVVADGSDMMIGPALIREMYGDVIAADGVAVMDFCSRNVGRGLGAGTSTLLRRINPNAHGGRIDAQEFWAWDFRPGIGGVPWL